MFSLLLVVVKAVAPLLVVGGALAAGSMVWSGLQNREAQKEANRTNALMSRRTNETNVQISREQNEFNLQSMREQMKYLSPADQRKMFEEAGYSPYAYLLTNGTGTPAAAQSAGLPAMTTPLMQPETGFGDAIGQIGSTFGGTLSSLGDAQLKTAQAVGQELENSVFSERTALSFEALGYQNQYQRILNTYAARKEEATLDLMLAEKELTDNQADSVALNNQIQGFYKDKIQPQELKELNARIKLLKEQGRTQISMREYYQAMGHSALIQAHASEAMVAINDYLSKFQAQMFAANALDATEHAKLNSAIKTGQIQENVLKTLFGVRFTKSQIQMIESSGGVNKAMIEKVYTENEQIQQAMSWKAFEEVVGAIVPLGIAGKILGVYGKLGKAIPKVKGFRIQ